MSTFTSRVIKGGALLEDSRRFLEAWDPIATVAQNLDRIRRTNALGKSSASRANAVIAILRQRFVDPGIHVVTALRSLTREARAFCEACYYEAGRADELLAAFAEGPLCGWRVEGRKEVTLVDVVGWLAHDSRTPDWGEETMTRVAHGLLSALRDFGILEGQVRKWFPPARLSLHGFAYVALRERSAQASDRALFGASVWRRYLLDESRARQLFLDADRARLLRFAEAGTALRIDWLVQDMEAASRVLAA